MYSLKEARITASKWEQMGERTKRSTTLIFSIKILYKYLIIYKHRFLLVKKLNK